MPAEHHGRHPTYRRDQVLVDTVRDLLALDPPPAEILVLDQPPRTRRTLRPYCGNGMPPATSAGCACQNPPSRAP